ncbi:MAG TPA: 1,4-alpha-glucan branching protein GlgB [Kofleriaceae bacterium]|nr:1,4-alpha-glucan branching protein GlgB [Kofleriaceae bacterium]
MTFLGDQDLHLFNEGTHVRLYRVLGAHPTQEGGAAGVHFAVWAPNAERVAVIGDFNGWDAERHRLRPVGSSGIWEGFVAGARSGQLYKFRIVPRGGKQALEKADPFGFRHQTAPETASMVWSLDYEWRDREWMQSRGKKNKLDAPISIYEVHLGSWRRVPEQGNRMMTYREAAAALGDYCAELGFTHVELMPLAEHPYYPSWGYQVTGYFAPTSRYGEPQDLMYMIDELHRRGIGVIIDWVPAHFPSDKHGLAQFDGTHLFEHADPRRGFHPDWGTLIFNYGRYEVRSFLLSSALFWLDHYHIDGLRVDAVASMLYLDYSRKDGGWIPNRYGGKENVDAIDFLRRFNEEVYRHHPDVQTFAEESTSWPMVSRPTSVGGLGFGLKWDMGWMHDTLGYLGHDPIHRRFHHNQLTFRGMYAFTENFVLPLSHDEVVHGKGSLWGRMPGDEWQKRANLRLLFGYMVSSPGKKLLFMGGEFGQAREWNVEDSLDWHLLDDERRRGLSRLVGDLNRQYRSDPALHELDCDPAGFEWIDGSDSEQSVLAFARRGKRDEDYVLVMCNFTPVLRENYRVGVPREGYWTEVLNTDSTYYGGSDVGNLGRIETSPVPWHGRPFSLNLVLPPLAVLWLRWTGFDGAGLDGPGGAGGAGGSGGLEG